MKELRWTETERSQVDSPEPTQDGSDGGLREDPRRPSLWVPKMNTEIEQGPVGLQDIEAFLSPISGRQDPASMTFPEFQRQIQGRSSQEITWHKIKRNRKLIKIGR